MTTLSTAWAVAALALTTATLTRLALLIRAAADVPVALWSGIFARGLWFDLATLGFALAPLLLYRALLPGRLRHHRIYRSVRWLALWLLLATLIFVALAEATFWLEFSTRFHFIAVDYLIYTHAVMGNIRESYPVNLLLGEIAVIAATALWLLRKRLALAPAVTAATSQNHEPGCCDAPARRLLAAIAMSEQGIAVGIKKIGRPQRPQTCRETHHALHP